MFEKKLTEDEFGTKLNQWVSPARPIQSIQHLQGRAKELAIIKKALFAPGRHIFIFGDRGVGKSSLAAAAANLCQSSDAPYIDIGCTPDSTLIGIVANIAYQAMNTSRLRKTKLNKSVGFEYKFLKANASHEVTLNDLHSEIKTLLDAVEVLREVAALHCMRPANTH